MFEKMRDEWNERRFYINLPIPPLQSIQYTSTPSIQYTSTPTSCHQENLVLFSPPLPYLATWKVVLEQTFFAGMNVHCLLQSICTESGNLPQRQKGQLCLKFSGTLSIILTLITWQNLMIFTLLLITCGVSYSIEHTQHVRLVSCLMSSSTSNKDTWIVWV